MKRIRTLLVKFDAEGKAVPIGAFRGGIANKAGLENKMFHNHLDNHSYDYGYPLIQYKRIKGQPSILFLGEGVDEAYRIFSKPDIGVDILGKKMSLKIDELNLRTEEVGPNGQIRCYELTGWLALNEQNLRNYRMLTDTEERSRFLERMLVGNILAFAKGIYYHIEDRISVKITKVLAERPVQFKSIPVVSFDIEFITNMHLPDALGLGKGVSIGYGILNQKTIFS
jgi:hypothetical protein